MAIDDDDVNCPYPTKPLHGSSIYLEIFLQYIELARIKSAISKRLLGVSARRRPAFDRLETIKQLDARLQDWRRKLPGSFHIKPSNASVEQSQEVRKELQLSFHLTYYALLITIHDAAECPWNKNTSDIEPGRIEEFAGRIEHSKALVAEASRQLIQSTRHISIEASSPTWMAFFYPILGMIHLFIHVVCHPTLPTVTSDIQLIDMAAGYFGHLDFSTGSALSFAFTRDLAHWARVRATAGAGTRLRVTQPVSPVMTPVETLPPGVDDLFSKQNWTSDMTNMIEDDWQTLLPSLSQVPFMPWNDTSNFVFEP